MSADAQSGAFPSTCWSQIVQTGASVDAERARERSFETLARAYWKPILAYIRARWAKTPDDALDRTQDFFVWVMETGRLAQADPARGRFRAFIKTALKHFIIDLERKENALKRGGKVDRLELDDAHEAFELPDRRGRSPDEYMDDVWRAELVARALERVEEALRSSAKDVYFDVFNDYFLGADEVDYQTLATRYDLKTSDVSNYLMDAKRRYRAALRDEVAETVRDGDELEHELAWLFGGAQR